MPALFDIAAISSVGSSPFAVFAFILRNGGLVAFYPLFVWMCWYGWKEWLQNKYRHKKTYALLAIDVPKQNEQSMKAVEQIMNALHGVHFNPNFKERNWIGVVMDKFSLEIISIDGYIQYFVYCDRYNVDMVKAAIYAQYPDAEIVEVEDYTGNVPHHYPHETHDMFGTEFTLANKDVYPIKTYEYFEDRLTGIFADPMAAILESLSRLRPGEQIWLQIVISPEGVHWREEGLEVVNELIERHVKAKKGIVDMVSDLPVSLLQKVHDAIWVEERGFLDTEHAEGSESGNFLNMTTGEKLVVEEIQKKISHIVWESKIRFCYFGRKEIFNVYRVVGPIFGVIKQFNSLDLNSLVPGGHTVTSGPVYFWPKRRQNKRKNKIVEAFIDRSPEKGEAPVILSNVELATLYHFPVLAVRAPSLSKAEAKKGEPPAHLPVEATSPFEPVEPEFVEETSAIGAATSPKVAAGAVPIGEPLYSMVGLPPGVKPVHRPAPTPYRPTPTKPFIRTTTFGGTVDALATTKKDTGKTQTTSASLSHPTISRPTAPTTRQVDTHKTQKGSPPPNLPTV